MDIKQLLDTARLFRKDVLKMIKDVSDGHPGASYSAADIITALYFSGVLNIKPNEPDWPDRDTFVLTGDGELQEGIVWESLHASVK